MSDSKQYTEPETAAKRRWRQAAESVGASAREAAGNVSSSVRAGIAQASRDSASAAVAGFAVAGDSVTKFAENLDWAAIDPSQFVHAGTRGADRTLEEARLVWESIPELLRALGPEEVERQLQGFDWSHIVPFSQGGGNEAANGIFELAELNQSRGAEPMTAAELDAASEVLHGKAFESALEEAVNGLLVGAGAGAAVSCVISCLEFGLDYQRGEITREELYRNIRREVVKSAVVGGSVSGILAITALAFPALIPVAAPLVMPLMAMGLCAVGCRVVRLGMGWYVFIRERSENNCGNASRDIIMLQGSGR